MAAGSWQLYNHMAQSIGDGTIDLDTDTFRAVLLDSGYTYSAAHSTWSDVSAHELATANGYTANGVELTNVIFTQTSGVGTFDADNPSWTASGAGLTCRRALIVKDTDTYADLDASDPIICSVLLDATPADVTVAAGNDLTVQINSGGIFTLTIA